MPGRRIPPRHSSSTRPPRLYRPAAAAVAHQAIYDNYSQKITTITHPLSRYYFRGQEKVWQVDDGAEERGGRLVAPEEEQGRLAASHQQELQLG